MTQYLPAQAKSSDTWFVRPLAALGLLGFEYLSISLSFESSPQLELFGDGSRASLVQMLGPAVIAWGTALWLLAGPQLRDTLQSSRKTEPSRPGLTLAVHLACFAIFFFVTSQVFGASAPVGEPALWVAAWLAGLVATVASVSVFALGAFDLRSVLHELARPLTLASLLGLLAFVAGLATRALWNQLSDWTLLSVFGVLNMLVDPVSYDPSLATVGTEAFVVEVSPVCSGYEGIGLVAVFVGAYLAFYRRRFRFPQVLCLLLCAMLLVWALNVIRIVALIGIGHLGYPAVAVGGFHSKAGWLVSSAVVLGAVWLSQRVDWFAREPRARAAPVVNPSLPFLLPLLAIVASQLAIGLFVTDFNYYYPVTVVVALLLLTYFRKDYAAGLRKQFAGRALWSWEAFVLGLLVFVIWLSMAALSQAGAQNGPPPDLLALPAPIRGLWISARVLGATLTIPIAEELAFRGFLLRRLISADFTSVSYRQWSWPAVVLSSLAFAMVHQAWLAAFFAGVLYAYAQQRRGLLSDAILAHAVTNALIAAQVLVGGQWSLW